MILSQSSNSVKQVPRIVSISIIVEKYECAVEGMFI